MSLQSVVRYFHGIGFPFIVDIFFLRFLKPSVLLTALIEDDSCQNTTTITTSTVSHVDLQVEDVESGHKQVGILRFEKKGEIFTVPGTYPITKLVPCMNACGILTTNDRFVNFLPVLFPYLGNTSDDFLVLYTKKSCQTDLFSCSPSKLHGVQFPHLPLAFSEADLIAFGPLLELFYSALLLSPSNICHELNSLFEALSMGKDGQAANVNLQPSILRDLSQMFQICHYLYATGRLEETNAWLIIYFVAFPTMDSLVLEFRNVMLQMMGYDTDLNANHQRFREILLFLSTLHPQNVLYTFFCHKLLLYK